MKRSPITRWKKTRLRSRRKGRSALAAKYALEFPTCQLCEHLLETSGYRKFSQAYINADWRYRELEIHHVWAGPGKRWEVGFLNFVSACGVCHDYCTEGWQQAGRLVCTWVKMRGGTFDRETVRDRWGRDPVAAIEADFQAGLFDADAALVELALAVIEWH